jgi:predicted small secreted protein
MLRKLLLTVVAGTIVLSAAACNTVKGAGKDLQSASDSTKDAINK